MLLFLVPGDELVKLGPFRPPEHEIRHVDPGHAFIRLGNLSSGKWARIRGSPFEHGVSSRDKPAVKDRVVLVEWPAH